ncbi:ABC transporter ATP-binding protein [Acetivibrio cellulolyticus]|uniref:ABC transporter ATP-binding protein n=1 Tax=Acetivibrio cellulolyticus TaxID=35830 RepID=UPI0001E2E377|nr:ABC transporter ATP-binding protein [Acetivibrio cellulolyticus]
MLKLENVRCGYEETEVLKGVSFDVREGEKICIIGPNGCGKTTLLKAIAGLIKSEGKIFLSGIPLNKMKRSQIASKIAILRQNEAIYFSYTVFETVMLGRYLHMKGGIFGGPTKTDSDFVLDCLEKVGVIDLKDRQIDTLSGGQLQRVFLAKALAQEPSLILLDEPTNHLDLKFQIELVEYLKQWAKKDGHSVIGVLHDINLAMHFADKILLLADGKGALYGDAHMFTDGRLLEEIYHMDIKSYMQESLKMWGTR